MSTTMRLHPGARVLASRGSEAPKREVHRRRQHPGRPARRSPHGGALNDIAQRALTVHQGAGFGADERDAHRTRAAAINAGTDSGGSGSGGRHRRHWPFRGLGDEGGTGDPAAARKGKLRKTLIASAAVFLMLAGVGLVAATYFVDSVETPDQLPPPESTTVFYSDGKTVMARLGNENRTNLNFGEMNDAVKDAAVAAEDRTFWTNEGVDLSAVMRAAWNNVTGGDGGRQGGSTIAQQYARYILDFREVTYSRKLREAVVAWKLTDKYSKEEILEFYLNTVPFGRGAYGIEAAAQAYFGKTASKNAKVERQVTVSEAAMLVANIKQPEPDPDNPINPPDMTRSARTTRSRTPTP